MIRLLRRVNRLIRWMPVIWHTGDWDYSYVLEILAHSLGELEQHLLDHDMLVCSKRNAKRIHYVRQMVGRYLNGTSRDMAYERHEKKWGEMVGFRIPIPNSDFVEWRSARLNARTTQEQERERKDFQRAMKEAHRLEQRDWDAIWDTIKKHGQRWWC